MANEDASQGVSTPAEAHHAAPLFSVIVPVCNGAAHLRKTLDSALNQRWGDYEIIVVDDGSTDDTPQILDYYAARITVVRQRNAGSGPARNAGAARASGRYLAFLDADDVWFPFTLSTLSQVIAQADGPAIVMGRAHRFTYERSLRGVDPQPLHYELWPSFMHAYLARPHFWGACAMAVRADVFHALNGFWHRRDNAVDTDFLLRCGSRTGPYARIVRPITVGYRKHSGSLTHASERVRAGQLAIRRRERAGLYPRDRASRRGRSQVLAFLYRDQSIKALRSGAGARAWQTYLRGMPYQLRARRVRYIAGFPPLSLAAMAGGGYRYLKRHE